MIYNDTTSGIGEKTLSRIQNKLGISQFKLKKAVFLGVFLKKKNISIWNECIILN